MNRKITLTGANIVFLIVTVAFIVYQVVLAILFGSEVFTKHIYLMLLVNEYIIILTPVLIYAFIKKMDLRKTFRLYKPGLAPAALILAISVPAYFVAAMLNNIVAYLLQFIGNIPSQPIPVPQNVTELLIGLLIIAVTPGICEEVLHRGLLLRAYEKRGSMKALVIVSIFFGLFHFDVTNLLGPIFLGLLIGYYVLRTNSLFAGMLAHFLNNAIAEVLQYLGRNQPAPDKITISAQELGSLMIYGFAGLIIAGGLLVLFRKVTEGRAVTIPPVSNVKRDIVSVISHWPIIVILILYFVMLMLFLLEIIIMKFMGYSL